MRISYDKGLEKLAKAMEEYGHELFPSDELAECDAILCKELHPNVRAGQKGALYLMAEGKTAAQLNTILKNRVYESLF